MFIGKIVRVYFVNSDSLTIYDYLLLLLSTFVTLSYFQTDFSLMRNRKLALSTIESILVVLASKGLTLTLEVEDADKCAFIIFAIVDGLSANIKHFDRERTLTETIFHQMIRYFFVLAQQNKYMYKVWYSFTGSTHNIVPV